jgi:hypothetical protein
MRRFSVVLLGLLPLCLCACPKEPAPAGADAASSVTPLGSASQDAGGAVRDAGGKQAARDGGAFSRAERAAFLGPLNEGRKKSRAKDWPGAMADFERALSVAPNDARVLAEMGWAALNANELAKAETANRRALALTKEPKLRAQILYNTGRVAEAKKDMEAARSAYAASLALRDNAEVKKRLAQVGGPKEPSVACAEGAPSIDALCACLMKGDSAPFVMANEKTVCAVDPSSLTLGSPKLSVVRYGAEMLGERIYMLAARNGAALTPLTEIGRDYEPGAFGVHNEAEVMGASSKVFGARTVVVVKSQQRDNDQNMAGLELCSQSEELESVCAVGDAPGKTRCFTVPVSISAGCGAGVDVDPVDLDAETRQTIEDMKARWSRSEVKLSWALSDDGKVVVQRSSGDASLIPNGLVGAHPLF